MGCIHKTFKRSSQKTFSLDGGGHHEVQFPSEEPLALMATGRGRASFLQGYETWEATDAPDAPVDGSTLLYIYAS